MATGTSAFMDKANDVRRDLSDLGSIAVDTAKHKVVQASESVGDLYDDGMKQVKSVQKRAESYIRKEPIKTVLIAGAVGFAIGWFLTRRNNQ